jgi:hypothetical protein
MQAAKDTEQLEAKLEAGAAELLAESQLKVKRLKDDLAVRDEALVQLQQARAQVWLV